MNNLPDSGSHQGHSFLDDLLKSQDQENCHGEHPHHFDALVDALGDSLHDALHHDDLLKPLDDHHFHISDNSGFLNSSDSDKHHHEALTCDDLLNSPDQDDLLSVSDNDDLLKSHDCFDAGLHNHEHSYGLETDRTDSEEAHGHQSGFGADWFDPDHHGHHHSHSSGITRTVFSSPSDSNVHVTVGSNTGHVYLNGDDIGYIEGHSVYNVSDWNCGYWTNEGKIYDAHDNLVGWVDSADGNLYVEGKDGNCKLYHTASHSIAEGAAYLLLVWFQGQTHR